jgi:sigma-B regulation protein RsbU (phosphoserine phosphatase)
MFDFFLNDDNRLEGMTLMDVSGHGITSALITMMARTVISRRFNDMRALPLNEVMEGINTVLNREMRGVYLYLTGILLRFHESRVEYVNAAHPDLLLSGETAR